MGEITTMTEEEHNSNPLNKEQTDASATAQDSVNEQTNQTDQTAQTEGSQESQESEETQETEVPEEPEEPKEPEEPVKMVEISEKRLLELETAESVALENLKRERAESINYRKRLQKQRDEFAELASVRVLNKVLTVQDDLRRVVENSNGEIPENHMEGIKLVQQRLEGIFNQEGVELIVIEEGKSKYDPKFMEAVVSQPIPNMPANIVIGVISQGFKKGDRVLRAAKVMISKAVEPPKETPAEQTEQSEQTSQSTDNSTEDNSQTQDATTGNAPETSENGGN